MWSVSTPHPVDYRFGTSSRKVMSATMSYIKIQSEIVDDPLVAELGQYAYRITFLLVWKMREFLC
jgi:hypothetical protein